MRMNRPDSDGGRNCGDMITRLAVRIRVGLMRRFCELTVFDARLYIRVRCVDQPA